MAPTRVYGMLRVTNVTLTLTRRQVIILMAQELQQAAIPADHAVRERWPDGRALMDWVRAHVRQYPFMLDTDGKSIPPNLVGVAAQYLDRLYPVHPVHPTAERQGLPA